SGLNDTSFLNGMVKTLTHPFFAGFSSAADTVFLVCAILLIPAVILSLYLKEVPLRLRSGLPARAETGAAEAGATAGGEPILHGAADGVREGGAPGVRDGIPPADSAPAGIDR